MDGVRETANACGLPLLVTGFGAAFSLHFTGRRELKCYRDTFDDDRQTLEKYLRLALDEGLFLLPDGRVCVSAVHTESDVAETLEAIKRVFR